MTGEVVPAVVIEGRVDGLPLARIEGRTLHAQEHLHDHGSIVSVRPERYAPDGSLVVKALARFT
jgi:hypothetical protein